MLSICASREVRAVGHSGLVFKKARLFPAVRATGVEGQRDAQADSLSPGDTLGAAFLLLFFQVRSVAADKINLDFAAGSHGSIHSSRACVVCSSSMWVREEGRSRVLVGYRFRKTAALVPVLEIEIDGRMACGFGVLKRLGAFIHSSNRGGLIVAVAFEVLTTRKSRHV